MRSARRRTQASTSANVARPQTRSQRVWTLLLIGSGTLLFVAAFVGTIGKDSIGGALFTAVAATVAYAIPASIAWAWLRGHPSQEPTAFTLATTLTVNDSTAARPTLTLRAAASARWVPLAFCLALSGGLIGLGVRGWMVYWNAASVLAPSVIAVVFLAMAYSYWSISLQADDSSIVYRFLIMRRFDRRQVAAIQIGRFVISSYTGWGRRVIFIGSDGSVLFTTTFYWWGKDQLEALARYLGIPIRVADLMTTARTQ